jgi:hypothetical protein
MEYLREQARARKTYLILRDQRHAWPSKIHADREKTRMSRVHFPLATDGPILGPTFP